MRHNISGGRKNESIIDWTMLFASFCNIISHNLPACSGESTNTPVNVLIHSQAPTKTHMFLSSLPFRLPHIHAYYEKELVYFSRVNACQGNCRRSLCHYRASDFCTWFPVMNLHNNGKDRTGLILSVFDPPIQTLYTCFSRARLKLMKTFSLFFYYQNKLNQNTHHHHHDKSSELLF